MEGSASPFRACEAKDAEDPSGRRAPTMIKRVLWNEAAGDSTTPYGLIGQPNQC